VFFILICDLKVFPRFSFFFFAYRNKEWHPQVFPIRPYRAMGFGANRAGDKSPAAYLRVWHIESKDRVEIADAE
jgi:hypothetical protein